MIFKDKITDCPALELSLSKLACRLLKQYRKHSHFLFTSIYMQASMYLV